MANRPRLQWKRSADMPTWLTATWEGAGPHDGANIHKVSGVASGEAWRWQVGRNMRTVAGFASTKQEASDRANEAWWEMMGMKD